MSGHRRTRSAVCERQRSALRWRVRALAALALSLLALGLLAVACAPAPQPLAAGPDPSDPSAHAGAVGYRSTIAPYTSQRPVEPAPWREQNERLTPAPKP
jgi:hypothetical protein